MFTAQWIDLLTSIHANQLEQVISFLNWTVHEEEDLTELLPRLCELIIESQAHRNLINFQRTKRAETGQHQLYGSVDVLTALNYAYTLGSNFETMKALKKVSNLTEFAA